MHKLDGPYPGKSKIAFLPMTDLNPSDESCIYTTLHFISKEDIKNNCTPILTFDQPLYWKTMMILQNEPIGSPLKSFVLKLGGFHTHEFYWRHRIPYVETKSEARFLPVNKLISKDLA